MPPSPQPFIAVCVGIADSVKDEIMATLNSSASRTTQYDRQTKIKLEYGVRTCERIAARIRGLIGEEGEVPAPPSDGAKLAAAIALLKELEPVIATGKESAWKSQTLHAIRTLTASSSG